MIPIFQRQDYREITQEWFTKGYYQEALAAYENIYQTERDNLSESDLFILDNRMASCAADAVIKQGKTDPVFFEKFTRYLEEYLDLARTTQKDRVSTEEPCTRLKEALELSIRFDETRLLYRAAGWMQGVVAVPHWGLSLALPVLLQKINDERIQFDRPNRVKNTRTLSQVYLDISASATPDYLHARAMVMNILSDLSYFEGDEKGEDEALKWVTKCLEMHPQDVFARKRKQSIEERQGVELQIRRFRHDTRNSLAGIESYLLMIFKLPEASNEPLNRYLKTLAAELHRIRGVDSVILRIQPRYKELSPVQFVADILKAFTAVGQDTVRIMPHGEPCQWLSDLNYLTLALQNLIRNSIEAFERRMVPLAERRLTVDIFYPERRLTVEDNAGGIDPTLGERLFLPYTSSKPIKLNTGLGLYQAREAMELMQGSLILSEHQPAGGTRFELSLTVRETI